MPHGGLCVGKADGREHTLGRWRTYARDGHGGNVAMRELATIDPTRPHRYRFSLLQVFPPHTPQGGIDDAEAHYKKALLARDRGLNRN